MEDIFDKRTKIVATIGPASRDKRTLIQLASAGANVFRLNFSHGTHEDHAETIKLINEINEEYHTNLATLQDLQGPKIRIGKMENEGVKIINGEKLIITTQDILGNQKEVSTTYKEIVHDVQEGQNILIDDGNIELKVESVDEGHVYTRIIHGGILKSRKGINLPDSNVSAPSLTEKDKIDLEFGLEHELEWIALSFVRKASDILELKEKIKASGKRTKVVAKIEKPEALDNIDDILDATDAVMVARGDLGVEIPMQDVPLIQKRLVLKCNRKGIPVIIATQMMESMIENPRPTRAETNDVANAVMDGADALMLSAESAAGKFPVEAVRRMSMTIKAVEKESKSIYHKYREDDDVDYYLSHKLMRAAVRLSESVGAKAIIGMTKSGFTGYRLAMHRPKSHIYICTNQKYLLRQINLVWGVLGIYYDKEQGIDETLKHIEEDLCANNYLEKGDVFINTASMPSHWKGHTNMMKVKTVD